MISAGETSHRRGSGEKREGGEGRRQSPLLRDPTKPRRRKGIGDNLFLVRKRGTCPTGGSIYGEGCINREGVAPGRVRGKIYPLVGEFRLKAPSPREKTASRWLVGNPFIWCSREKNNLLLFKYRRGGEKRATGRHHRGGKEGTYIIFSEKNKGVSYY